MTSESRYLQTLARRVVGAAVKRTAIRAALLAGSAGRGNADRFSDLDLLFYVDSVPTSETVTAIRTAVDGVNPLRRYEPTDYANGEEFQLHGVRTEVVFLTVEHVERQLDELLDQLQDVASSRQKLLAGIAEGLALLGEELIACWRARLQPFPEPFRRAMIERHWDFFPLWYYAEAMAARDTKLWRLDVLLDGAFNLLGVLAGLNRIYFARFELKRTRELVAKMELAPPALADRIENLFRLPPSEAAITFATLIEETRQLVHHELPDLHLELPQPLSARQARWSMLPAPSEGEPSGDPDERATPAYASDTQGREWIEALQLTPQRELLLSLLHAVEGDQRFRALEVGCSLGRGNADERSDVDVGIWIEDASWDTALTDLEPLLRRLASTVDAVGFDAPWGRWFFAQYADGRQLDVAAQRASSAQRRPPDSIVLFDRDGILEARTAKEPVDRRAEWAFLAWFELGNVPKYIARGSMWEALAALEQARSEFLRLHAANIGAANPEFGVTSIFDAPGGDVPLRLAEAYPSPDFDGVREAARVLSGLLIDAWEPPPLAEWVKPQL